MKRSRGLSRLMRRRLLFALSGALGVAVLLWLPLRYGPNGRRFGLFARNPITRLRVVFETNRPANLIEAVERNDVRLVQGMLARSVDANMRDADGRTALLAALQDGSGSKEKGEIIQLLLAHGADIRHLSFNGERPLDMAVASNAPNAAVLKDLIRRGADPNAHSEEGTTPLLMLVSNAIGSPEAVRALLDGGADPNARDKQKMTPLIHLISNGNSAKDQKFLDTIALLIDRGADPNYKQKDVDPVLFSSIYNDEGGVRLLQLLLRHKADPNIRNGEGQTPLIYAAQYPEGEYNALPAVRALLDAGADPNLPDRSGETVLHIAVSSNNLGMTTLLLERGGNPNLSDKRGDTPLLKAAFAGYLGFVRLLLIRGANVNQANKEGVTPLMAAVWGNHLPVVNFLLTNGADFRARDTEGKTARDWANLGGLPQIARHLPQE